MTSIEDRKQAWLDYCGLNNSEQDRRLRDRVAALFDIEAPTRLQREILARADVRRSLLDLPANAYRQQRQEFIALIRREIWIDRARKWGWLPLLALTALIGLLALG